MCPCLFMLPCGLLSLLSDLLQVVQTVRKDFPDIPCPCPKEGKATADRNFSAIKKETKRRLKRQDVCLPKHESALCRPDQNSLRPSNTSANERFLFFNVSCGQTCKHQLSFANKAKKQEDLAVKRPGSRASVSPALPTAIVILTLPL